jgi:hypothetical protein
MRQDWTTVRRATSVDDGFMCWWLAKVKRAAVLCFEFAVYEQEDCRCADVNS